MSERPPDGITLANWDAGGPRTDWAFRNTRGWLPTATLTSGLAAPHLSSRPRPVPEFVARAVGSGRVTGYCALVRGEVAHSWRADQPRLLMSVSKVATSLAIGLLAGADRLSYDAPVRHHLPGLGPQWDGCTVRHVLHMTSGVGCREVADPGAYIDPASPFYRFEASLGWRPAQRPITPYELVRGYDRSGRPGAQYNYTSVNTFLLGWIIEEITGGPYQRALQTLLWDDLALTREAAITTNAAGVAAAHGGLIMTTADLARFGAIFTPSGAAVGHHVRVPAGYEAMLQETTVAPPPWLPPGQVPAGQWNWVSADGDRFKSGFGGQGLFVSPTPRRRDRVHGHS